MRVKMQAGKDDRCLIKNDFKTLEAAEADADDLCTGSRTDNIITKKSGKIIHV